MASESSKSTLISEPSHTEIIRKMKDVYMCVVMFALISAAQECSTLLSQSILLHTETNILFHSPLLNERASIAAKYIIPEVVWNCLPALFLVSTRLSMCFVCSSQPICFNLPSGDIWVTMQFWHSWSLSLSFLTITLLSVVWCACCKFPWALVCLYGP